MRDIQPANKQLRAVTNQISGSKLVISHTFARPIVEKKKHQRNIFHTWFLRVKDAKTVE